MEEHITCPHFPSLWPRGIQGTYVPSLFTEGHLQNSAGTIGKAMLFLLGGSRIAWRNGAEYEINTTKQSRETEGEIFLKTELAFQSSCAQRFISGLSSSTNQYILHFASDCLSWASFASRGCATTRTLL